jgi:hypothetical protein
MARTFVEFVAAEEAERAGRARRRIFLVASGVSALAAMSVLEWIAPGNWAVPMPASLGLAVGATMLWLCGSVGICLLAFIGIDVLRMRWFGEDRG